MSDSKANNAPQFIRNGQITQPLDLNWLSAPERTISTTYSMRSDNQDGDCTDTENFPEDKNDSREIKVTSKTKSQDGISDSNSDNSDCNWCRI